MHKPIGVPSRLDANKLASGKPGAVQTTPRPAQRFTFVGDLASEPETQSRPLLKALLGRTPDAF